MIKAILVVALFCGLSQAFQQCKGNEKITDKATGKKYTPQELLTLSKELQGKLLACGNTKKQDCDTMPPLKSWISDNCTKKNVCVNNKKYEQPNACNENAHCGFENEMMTCVCDDGFNWSQENYACVKA
ncbi:hypothetical protein L596_000145 [Steinernema carpocapsae]|uniref:EGF-like domain-containing protein n=1 Tax=Steinernema carpocapsae TaxID=34508 RepID=A0A4U8UI12_STECR|nr:hypothetical protein L596_000145 [Steinernema carpocapsae]